MIDSEGWRTCEAISSRSPSQSYALDIHCSHDAGEASSKRVTWKETRSSGLSKGAIWPGGRFALAFEFKPLGRCINQDELVRDAYREADSATELSMHLLYVERTKVQVADIALV